MDEHRDDNQFIAHRELGFILGGEVWEFVIGVRL